MQLKAVSENYITYSKDSIKYVLEVKNYNDLIERAKESGNLIPLILIVFIVPTDQKKWIESVPDGLITRKEAYWFNLTNESKSSSNSTNITIEIPIKNKVDIDLFPNLFSTLWT